jgi:hypothetical protein
MADSIGDAIEGIEPSNQTAVETPATPEGQAPTEAVTEAPDSFTKLDPNAIPPEVKPYYDSMLSDYTRKTQEAAPWRKLGEELGVESPEAIREAAELYVALQDPNNLSTLYNQLSQVFGQEPTAPATAAQPEFQGDEDFAAMDNPVLAQVQAELRDLRDYVSQRDTEQQQEALQWQLLGELNRQEAMLKEQHPDWGDEEWNALWNLSVAFDGDLNQAATYVESAQNAAVTRLLNGKAQAAETPGLTPIAPSRDGVVVQEQDYSDDPELKGPTAQAVDYLRQVAAQSE